MAQENLFDVQRRGDGIVVQRPDKLASGGLTREEALNLVAAMTHLLDPNFETVPDLVSDLAGQPKPGAPPEPDASPGNGRTGAPDF